MDVVEESRCVNGLTPAAGGEYGQVLVEPGSDSELAHRREATRPVPSATDVRGFLWD